MGIALCGSFITVRTCNDKFNSFNDTVLGGFDDLQIALAKSVNKADLRSLSAFHLYHLRGLLFITAVLFFCYGVSSGYKVIQNKLAVGIGNNITAVIRTGYGELNTGNDTVL